MSAVPPPELVDELDFKGVPDELIQDWATREARNLESLGERSCGERVQPLRQELREAALQFLRGLVEMAGLPQGSWFDAVLLLDYCYLGGSVNEEALPTVCAVLVSLLKKNDTATSAAPLADLAHPTTLFGRWMCGMGCIGPVEVTQADLRRQETTVLGALDWQLNWPSVRTWLLALCDRLDVLMRHLLTSSFEWIFAQGMASAVMLVTHHSASSSMSPRRMANGLLCIFLAAGGLVPLAALRPKHLSEEEWEDRFCKSQCIGSPPSCLLCPARAASVLAVLRPVTGCEFQVLQADALAVVEAMVAVVQKVAQAPDRARWPQQQWQQERWPHQDSPQRSAPAPRHHRSPQRQQQDAERGQRLVAVC